MNGTVNQARWWFGTIKKDLWDGKTKPPGCVYVRGQLERGSGESKYEHWQIVLQFSKPTRRGKLVKWVSGGFFEPTRSEKALEYVWKNDTRIGEPFELGDRALKRNDAKDWDEIKKLAQSGRIDEVPGDIFVRYFGNLQVRNIKLENRCCICKACCCRARM